MYREILTKAVVGKSKISNSDEITVKTEKIPSKVLGCWVINHFFISKMVEGHVYVNGRYDIHIWYGHNKDEDTSIHKQSIEYTSEFIVKMKENERLDESKELSLSCLKYPTCSALTLKDDGSIIVKIDKEISLDVIGETKIKVQLSSADDGLENNDINNINVDYMGK